MQTDAQKLRKHQAVIEILFFQGDMRQVHITYSKSEMTLPFMR